LTEEKSSSNPAQPDVSAQKESPEKVAARAAFSSASTISDVELLFASWPSFVGPLFEQKSIAPICRIYVGDQQGKVIFERNLVVSTAARLTEELLLSIAQSVDLGKEYPFPLDIPVRKKEFVQCLERISKLSAHVASLAKKQRFSHLGEPNEDDARDERDSSSKLSGPSE
jgi:hypothetical protein